MVYFLVTNHLMNPKANVYACMVHADLEYTGGTWDMLSKDQRVDEICRISSQLSFYSRKHGHLEEHQKVKT